MPRKRHFEEGALFSISDKLRAEGIVGLLARYYGIKRHFQCGCYFFRDAALASTVDPELLKSLAPIKICQTTDQGFLDQEWKVLAMVPNWNHERVNWPMPTFKYVDVMDPNLTYLRTYDDITNEMVTNIPVASSTVETEDYLRDGLEGHWLTERCLLRIVEEEKEALFRAAWQWRK